jgi:DNA modification methylase
VLQLQLRDRLVGLLSSREFTADEIPAHLGSCFRPVGLKPKDLIGIPWRVAFALQADGWYLRQDIIWSKPNPMPESVTDRCTKAHEYLFLLSKSARYFYDAGAIAEQAKDWSVGGPGEGIKETLHYGAGNGGNGGLSALAGRYKRKRADRIGGNKHNDTKHSDGSVFTGCETRNKRSVWTVNTQSFPEAHFATFPPALIEPCILAGCPKGGTVLDPFGGAGTTGLVADRLGRNAILIELNPEYAAIAERRIKGDAGMFAEVKSIAAVA